MTTNKPQIFSTKPVMPPAKDVKALLQSDNLKRQMALVLPKHLTADRMARVALTAVLRTPKLMGCSVASMANAMLRCAQYGIEPDGRRAHLIPYGTDAELIIDWKGLVELAGRNGVQVESKLVCQNDTFSVEEDDGTGKTKVMHIVDYTKPRGEAIAVYSRARYNGLVDYEVMTADEVETVRQRFSRAKDAKAWADSWGEMARKTVIRRHSKRWPIDAEKAEAFESDEPRVSLGDVVTDAPAPRVKPLKAIDVEGTDEPEAVEVPVTSKMHDTHEAPADSVPVEAESDQNGGVTNGQAESAGRTPQSELASFMDDAGVTFDDFRDWARITLNCPDAPAWKSWESVSEAICESLKANPKLLTKCVKAFGRKQ